MRDLLRFIRVNLFQATRGIRLAIVYPARLYQMRSTLYTIYYMRFMIILAYQRGFQGNREMCLILPFFIYFNGHSGPGLGREES